MRASRRIPLLTASGLMVPALAVARAKAIAVGVTNILVAGGATTDVPGDSDTTAAVECYTEKIVRSTLIPLSHSVTDHRGAFLSGYGIFFGGSYYDENHTYTVSASSEAYSELLAHSNLTPLSVARGRMASVSNNSHAIVAGGSSNAGIVATVDAYSSSLVRSTATALSVARYIATGAGNASYLLICGGKNTSDLLVATVDAYSNTLTRSTATALAEARAEASGARIGESILVAGGVRGYGIPEKMILSNAVDIYDATLTHAQHSVGLSVARRPAQGISGQLHAVFGGGYKPLGTLEEQACVDAFDATLTRHNPTNMRSARDYVAGGANSNYMMLFGGEMLDGSGYSNAVDVYNLNLEHFATA